MLGCLVVRVLSTTFVDVSSVRPISRHGASEPQRRGLAWLFPGVEEFGDVFIHDVRGRS